MPRISWLAQRQLVEAVEQHRQPLGGAEHVEEGVEAGGLGVLAQQPLADRVPGADPELLVGVVEERLDALAAAAAPSARVEAISSTRSGAAMPSATRRASRRASTSVLPVPALAEDQQRPRRRGGSRARSPAASSAVDVRVRRIAQR